ncbi:MAG: family 20 glycosylhydrolase, partial [Chitinophagaceae bacterium]
MKNIFAFLILLSLIFLGISPAVSQSTPATPKDTLPIRGFSITAPLHSEVDSFVTFIRDALVPRHVNTLILLVDYKYQYKSHPELVDSGAMSERDARKIVKVCKENGIKIVPEIDLLGHQSWAGTLNKLLTVYPQFDETPWVKMPEHYVWPNPDNLYCKSYCPESPGLHKIIFSLINELCNAFETNDFHAGMDEVFY